MTPARLAALAIAGAVFAVIYATLPARDDLGRPLPLSFLLGGAFGVVLQRGRFCFWCNLRDWLEARDPRGLIAILVALATGTVGYAAILGAWMPNPFAGRLPPDAHVGPVSFTLVAGALAFGIGMALSGSCISAHLYRLGEGAFGSLLALAGALLGFGLGFWSWNTLFLLETHRAQPLWLPAWFGYGGTVALTLTLLGAAAWLLQRRGGTRPADATRWPPVVTGLLVGGIATLAYLRVGPLGVTAELGSLARTGAAAAGWLPEVLYGLDGLAGCATVVKETLISRNGVFVLGMVIAAFGAAQAAGQWAPARPRLREAPRLFLGGVLLGWGAMVSLGCTVGVLLSGTMAGAVSGWVFLVAGGAGGWIGWHLRRTGVVG